MLPSPRMPEERDRIQFVADRGDSRLRLDQVLVRRVSDVSRLSRSVAQHWIECGAVTVDRVTSTRPAARVREGATVEVALPSSARRRVRPAAEAGTVDVLFEDDHLLIANKPAGIVVHPSYKQAGGTLLNAVLWRLRDRTGVQPGILTRLDKDTSGIVVIGLSAEVHAALQRESAAGHVKKEYLAVVRGAPRPASGTIRLALARDPDDRRRIVPMDGGAPSETRYEVLSTDGEHSLVRCELVTGRTHQIRVHLSASGWPIVGDRVYGKPDVRIARQALHAWRVSLPHPLTKEPVEIEAPIPADIAALT
jgi:23S rRNA pseudouridine1911/1915/1917 synthase